MKHVTRPRVLLVVTAAITAKLFMRGYAEFLVRHGYDVTLVTNEIRELDVLLAGTGVDTRELPMRREPHPLGDVRSLIAMTRLIREVRPDAVVYATPKASLLASVSGWLLRVPVRIYGLWGIRFETATGAGRRVLRAIEVVIARCSTAILANSKSLADRAVELGVAARDRVGVIGEGSSHGVDLDRFSPAASLEEVDEDTARFLSAGEGFTVGYIGRLHQDKGIDVLCDAMAVLASDGVQTRLLLVGGYEGADVPSVEGCPTRLVGEVDDVRPYLRRFDTLVLMSRREGFPNVVLEAAAMEIPSIVSDATGCVDAVVDEDTGFVVPVGDTQRLAARLRTLASEPDLRAHLGQRARARVENHFGQEMIWAKTEEHLRTQLHSAHVSNGGQE